MQGLVGGQRERGPAEWMGGWKGWNGGDLKPRTPLGRMRQELHRRAGGGEEQERDGRKVEE